MINTKTKGELGRRIEYDVEHDLFHPQNIYSDEYITPTFVEYVQKLEKENAKLKCECRRCVHTDCPCVLSDYGKDRNGICDHFKDVFDENAELKNKLEHRNCLDCSNHSSKLRMKTLELEKECTKAKEIIRDLINLTEPTSTEEVQHWNETFRKAEKFLSEVENV